MCTTVLGCCGATNHYLIHPHEPGPQVVVWSGDFARDQIEIHIEGARPPGGGPRQPQQATAAWNATLEWLERHLRPIPNEKNEPPSEAG